MMKRTGIMMLCLLIIVCSVTSVQATESRAVTASPTLTFGGGQATCSVQVVSAGDPITVTMELWYGSALLGRWTGSGTSVVSLSKSISVSSGLTYTLMVYGTVDGTSFYCNPLSRTYS